VCGLHLCRGSRACTSVHALYMWLVLSEHNVGCILQLTVTALVVSDVMWLVLLLNLPVGVPTWDSLQSHSSQVHCRSSILKEYYVCCKGTTYNWLQLRTLQSSIPLCVHVERLAREQRSGDQRFSNWMTSPAADPPALQSLPPNVALKSYSVSKDSKQGK
jgi:hypothetical protein